MIRPELLGTYVNPDEIEKQINTEGFLDLRSYQVDSTEQEILRFFQNSSLLQKIDCLKAVVDLQYSDQRLKLHHLIPSGYFASVAADFIRKKLLANLASFTFETVMSFPDKIELLKHAQSKGYRTYLYYVATESPEINVSRVRYRVSLGGHSVPEDKIVSRYHRSIDLLAQAIQSTNRAYIFDNSTHEHVWLAEITNGKNVELKTSQLPSWFQKVLKRLS